MAADGNLLQGEINEGVLPSDSDVERLLAGFLLALLDEQRAGVTARAAAPSDSPAARLLIPEAKEGQAVGT